MIWNEMAYNRLNITFKDKLEVEDESKDEDIKYYNTLEENINATIEPSVCICDWN